MINPLDFKILMKVAVPAYLWKKSHVDDLSANICPVLISPLKMVFKKAKLVLDPRIPRLEAVDAFW